MERAIALESIVSARERPRRPDLLFVGFKAWAGPAAGRGAPLRERLDDANTRAIWDMADGRLVLGVAEYDSVDDALEGLARRMEANKLEEIPTAPPDLGEIGFVHPEGLPPAAFFVRGNLVLSVVSFSREPVEVLAFAQLLDAELLARPEQVHEGGLEIAEESGLIRARARWGGSDAYLKFVAPGTTLRKREDGVQVEGEPSEIEIYVIEPGRATYGRKLTR